MSERIPEHSTVPFVLCFQGSTLMVATWASRVVNKCFTSQINSFFLEIKVRLLFKVIFMINWQHCRYRRRRLRPLRVLFLLYFAGLPRTEARPFRTSALPQTVTGCCRCCLTERIDARTGGDESPGPSAALPGLTYLLQGQVRNRLLLQKQGNRCCDDSLGFPSSTGKSWAVTDETNFDTTNPGRRSLPVAPERWRKHG